AQGLLTNKYLHGVPDDSRAASGRGNGALEAAAITEALLAKVRHLDGIAQRRGQSLAQMALGWILKDRRITSVIVGASRPEQVIDSTQCLENYYFSEEELEEIESIIGQRKGVS
ncbi:MAG TPA: aldo/keto reductase, partial [Chitinophagaceae bacterium]